MSSTFLLAIVIAGLLLVWSALWAVFLRLGLKWARVQAVTWRRVVVATAIVTTLQVVLNGIVIWVWSIPPAQSAPIAMLALAMPLTIPLLVVILCIKASLPRQLQAWLPTLIASAATVALSTFVVRPLTFEAFVIPTNAMAPTLLGDHWQDTCPVCGKPNHGAATDGMYPALTSWMICEQFHVSEAAYTNQPVSRGDRILVAKFMTPRRWDLVVFQAPEDPTNTYVKRLVGLPGETIRIEDGAVWVDGKRLTPPAPIADITYELRMSQYGGRRLWGSAEQPAQLGVDEYFVLGDFSQRSYDSRTWHHGAPGHNPFAVPESHFIGVVTHTYWPRERWRVHR